MKFSDSFLRVANTQIVDSSIYSVNIAIDLFKEIIAQETPLDIKLLYFTYDSENSNNITLHALLEGFTDEEVHPFQFLIEITQEEADASWISIYK